MNYDHVRTDPPGREPIRPLVWFSWHDDGLPAPGGGADRAEPRADAREAGSNGGNGNGANPSLSDERLNALRRWIADGGHNSVEVAEQVARRILESGEL